MKAIAQQSKAGRKRVLAGFVSKQWENAQNLRRTGGSKRILKGGTRV